MALSYLDDLQPERVITVKIKAREAALINLLRKYKFVEVLVKKQKGYIVSAQVQESILIREEDGLELAKDVIQQ